MRKRISVSISCLAAALALLVSIPATAATGPTAVKSGGLASCEILSFRGKHHVSQRNLGCGAAHQKARFVIKRLKAPSGWNCSGRINHGYATCHSGRKVFSVSPA
jgi:hypothetical protein